MTTRRKAGVRVRGQRDDAHDPRSGRNGAARHKPAAARAAVDELASTGEPASIRQLLRDEPQRTERLTIDAAGLHVDLSRQRLPEAALDALLALARAVDVEGQRNAMFAGEAVNFTERRPAWHVALRAADTGVTAASGSVSANETGDVESGTSDRVADHAVFRVETGGRPAEAPPDAPPEAPASPTLGSVRTEVATALARVCDFAESVRAGRRTGASGRPLRAVVHVGIGGSHLGPQLACEALAPVDAPVDVRFLSNVDPDAFTRATAGLDPHETLVIIASKSWHTAETARNGQALRRWLLAAGVPAGGLHRHLAAVTSNVDGALADGLTQETIFPMWDWVGGRYSMWSAIGLPVALAAGAAQFRSMLAGARAMDRHFREAPAGRNGPVLMALVSLWNRLTLDGGSEAVVPYSDRLRSLVAYLQQLQMESNGKRVDRDGRPVAWQTVPVIWGATGTDAQHSFFQALHQGTAVHPVEFILVVPGADDDEGRGRALLANALAQIEALTCGRESTDASARDCPDRRENPSVQSLDQSPGQSLDQSPNPSPGKPSAAAPARAATEAGSDSDEGLAAHQSIPGNRPSTAILLEALDAERFGALIALYEHKTAVLGWLWEIDSFDQWGVELGKTLATDLERRLGADAASPPAGAHPVVEPLIRRLRRALAARNRRPAGPPAG